MIKAPLFERNGAQVNLALVNLALRLLGIDSSGRCSGSEAVR